MQKNARRGLTSVFWFYLDATAIGSKLGAAAIFEGVDGLLNEMRPEAPRERSVIRMWRVWALSALSSVG
jgi:hypothetical protein